MSGAPVLDLRAGSEADAAEIVALQKAASVTAFAHVFPPERYPYPEQEVLADLLARLAAGSELIVAESGGALLGFAVIGEGRLEQLYVSPDRWGAGIGGVLHDEAVRRRRDAGDERLLLWTLEENHRSRAFYERRGWRLDGRTRVVPFPPNPLDIGYALDLRIEPC